MLLDILSLRGFTKFSRADYVNYKKEGRIQPDGVNAKVIHDFFIISYILLFVMQVIKNGKVGCRFLCSHPSTLLFTLVSERFTCMSSPSYLMILNIWLCSFLDAMVLWPIVNPEKHSSLNLPHRLLEIWYCFCRSIYVELMLSISFGVRLVRIKRIWYLVFAICECRLDLSKDAVSFH